MAVMINMNRYITDMPYIVRLGLVAEITPVAEITLVVLLLPRSVAKVLPWSEILPINETSTSNQRSFYISLLGQ